MKKSLFFVTCILLYFYHRLVILLITEVLSNVVTLHNKNVDFKLANNINEEKNSDNKGIL